MKSILRPILNNHQFDFYKHRQRSFAMEFHFLRSTFIKETRGESKSITVIATLLNDSEGNEFQIYRFACESDSLRLISPFSQPILIEGMHLSTYYESKFAFLFPRVTHYLLVHIYISPPFPFEAAAKGIPFQSGLTRV